MKRLLYRMMGRQIVRNWKKMVNEVNLKQVAPGERLANKVYHYDAENKVFELAESF